MSLLFWKLFNSSYTVILFSSDLDFEKTWICSIIKLLQKTAEYLS